MNVSDIMSSPVYVMEPEEPVSHARKLMLRHKISTIVVVEGNKMVGIVTKSDLGRRLAQAEPMWRRRPIDKVPVKMIMTEDPVTIYKDASVSQATALMVDNDINNIPVVNNGELVGIVTRVDVVRCMSELPVKKNLGEIMTADPIFVHRHHTLNHVVDEMEINKVSKLIVTDDSGEAVGFITTRELALHVLTDNEGQLPSKNIKMARRAEPSGEKIYRYIKTVPLVAEDVMSDIFAVLDVGDDITKAAKIMVDKNITGIPIAENNEIVGIVSRTDIMRAA
ncbi:CBS domain-containing protein [Methanococcoides burtonii]|uniref:Cystathionine beta-synthase domain-containing protein n=1 Tax=Methanococcoides burtonii (strain DSM 6242 / NBRC 107633 / OCM 468 / ACE-M) TaxID=259564 RepID=Q12V76_METBU|nr:CBS domain-containing protein [Methanococcoides burtonii]ABE52650.1 Cystathionine beta-synthase domain-containing protein [Methanococcoides burtonii DSM 6242]